MSRIKVVYLRGSPCFYAAFVQTFICWGVN